MPVLSRFYGIAIKTGEVLDGHLPPKALSMVRE